MTGRAPQFKLPAGLASPDDPIASREQMLAHFAVGEKPRGPFRVGVELELLPILADGTAAPYGGDGASVERLLRELGAARGMTEVLVRGHVVGLQGPDGPVHLEPGGQVELALPPRDTAAEIRDDLVHWREALRDAGRQVGITLLPVGLQPVSRVADIGWNPRQRYTIMREHLGRRGHLAHHMMKATAGTQYNVDHASEADAALLFRASLGASPIVNALFANSPLEEGRPNGWLTIRPHVWKNTDLERTGLLTWAHEPGFSYERWLDWTLSSTVMFVLRDDEWLEIGDRTFARFLDEGHPVAGAPQYQDFVLHLTTLFPEVRLKQHCEIRGADSGDTDIVVAGAALWRGLLYDATARAEAIRLTSGWTADEREQLHEDASRVALAARIRGRAVRDLAAELIDIAADGLARIEGSAGRDADLLEPLREIASSGVTRAETLLRDFTTDGPSALLARA